MAEIDNASPVRDGDPQAAQAISDPSEVQTNAGDGDVRDVFETLRGLPSHAVKDLLSIGVSSLRSRNSCAFVSPFSVFWSRTILLPLRFCSDLYLSFSLAAIRFQWLNYGLLLRLCYLYYLICLVIFFVNV